MPPTPPGPRMASIVVPTDVWVVRTAKEAGKRSRELLDETKPLVEPRRHWPDVQDHGKTGSIIEVSAIKLGAQVGGFGTSPETRRSA